MNLKRIIRNQYYNYRLNEINIYRYFTFKMIKKIIVCYIAGFIVGLILIFPISA